MIGAVVDLNVLISAFILARGLPFRVLDAWQQAAYSLVSSDGMILELEGKLRAPRLTQRYRLTSHDIGAFLALLRTQAELVLVPADEIRAITGDPEDDLVLATGRLARADYLVTGDKRLLELGRYEGTQIVSPREFVEAILR